MRTRRFDASRTRLRLLCCVAVPVTLVVAFLTYLAIASSGNNGGDRPATMRGWAARLAGAPISEAELGQCALSVRAGVYGRFAKFGLRDGPRFWSTRVGGTTPRANLIELALQTCRHEKAIEEAARAVGVVTDISYGAFLRHWHAWNAGRQKARDRGDVVYGPIRYSEEDFRFKELDDLESAATMRLKAAGRLDKQSARQTFAARVAKLERTPMVLNRQWLRSVPIAFLLS